MSPEEQGLNGKSYEHKDSKIEENYRSMHKGSIKAAKLHAKASKVRQRANQTSELDKKQ